MGTIGGGHGGPWYHGPKVTSEKNQSALHFEIFSVESIAVLITSNITIIITFTITLTIIITITNFHTRADNDNERNEHKRKLTIASACF